MSDLFSVARLRTGPVFALTGMLLWLTMAGSPLTPPAHALTLYICIDAAGKKTYQDSPPSAAECTVEQREVDPDANVISAQDFIGRDASDSAGRTTRPYTGEVSTSGAGVEPNAAISQEPGAVTTTSTPAAERAAAAQTGGAASTAGTTPAASGAATALPAAAAGGF